MKKDYSEQDKLCALITEIPLMWSMYYGALTVMFVIVCVFGKHSAGAHLNAALCFLLALIGLTGALKMEYQRELIQGERYPSQRRLVHTLAAAAVCALCCGILENPSTTLGAGFALSGMSSKALSTLLSALGFAGVFGAFVAEFSAGRAGAGAVSKEIFTVTAITTKHGWFAYERLVEAVDARGKTHTLRFDLSIPDVALYDNLDRCLNLAPGMQFELVSSNIGPGYVSAILEADVSLKSEPATF